MPAQPPPTMATRSLTRSAGGVGELEGDAEIARVTARRGFDGAENFRGHETDDAGDTVAIAFERREIEISIVVEVHRHAVDNRLKILLRQLERRDDRRERERNRMPRRSAERRSEFAAPPRELEPRDTRIGDLIDDVVDLAAEGVQRDDRSPAL